MKCSLSSIVMILSFYIYLTDAQKKMKGKVHVLQDEELASLLGEIQETHQKVSKVPLQTSKSRIMPFIRKPLFMQTKNLAEEERDTMTSKVHYISDAEIDSLLNYLNASTSNKLPQPLEKFEPYEINEDRWERSVLNQPQSNINIDSLPLHEYSKVYLVVNPDAVKNTENQKTLTDLITKVMTARRNHRRLDDAADKYGDRDRRDHEDNHPDREDNHRDYDRKESKQERDAGRQNNELVALGNSRTARPISRGADRENRMFSDFDD